MFGLDHGTWRSTVCSVSTESVLGICWWMTIDYTGERGLVLRDTRGIKREKIIISFNITNLNEKKLYSTYQINKNVANIWLNLGQKKIFDIFEKFSCLIKPQGVIRDKASQYRLYKVSPWENILDLKLFTTVSRIFQFEN